MERVALSCRCKKWVRCGEPALKQGEQQGQGNSFKSPRNQISTLKPILSTLIGSGSSRESLCLRSFNPGVPNPQFEGCDLGPLCWMEAYGLLYPWRSDREVWGAGFAPIPGRNRHHASAQIHARVSCRFTSRDRAGVLKACSIFCQPFTNSPTPVVIILDTHTHLKCQGVWGPKTIQL